MVAKERQHPSLNLVLLLYPHNSEILHEIFENARKNQRPVNIPPLLVTGSSLTIVVKLKRGVYDLFYFRRKFHLKLCWLIL